MLRAGVTDAVHSDVGGGGDGADGPHPWIFEGDNDTGDPLSFGGCDAAAGDGDNLSIDLDALYNLLDSEQPVSPSFQEDALQANQSEGNTHFEKASSPQDGIAEALLGLPLEVEEHGHSKCTSSHDLDTSSFKEGNDLVSSYEASKCPKSLDLCNQSSEFVKPPDSHLIDISSSMSHASNWLSLSTLGYKNSLVDSAGCSVPMVSGFEYQQLQTQSPETLASEISVYKSIHGSQHAEPSNNIHLGFKKGRESVQRDGDSLDGAAMSCKDKTFISSSNHFQQSQAADSSHFISMGTYNFGNVHNDVCMNAMLNTGRQEEKTCSTAVDSSNDLGANPPNMLNVELNDLDSYSPNVHNAELNNGWATEMTWNAWPYLPVTMNSFPEVYAEDSAENISMQFLPGQLSQSFISCDRQHMINGKVKEEGQGHVSSGGCTGNEVKPFLPPDDTSFLDSDSSLSEISCNGTNYVENIHPQCAPYPYSFPVCSSTSYTNENNRHLADSSETLLADSQLFVQNKKQKIYSENVKKDQFLMVSQKQFHLAKSVTPVPSKDLYGDSMNVDEDPDICIIDDISNANDPPCPVVPKKSYVVPPYYPRTSSSRCQADDEKLTFQIALQDLAQPKSEASPPEGVLAVPLLRHQRIALSWMVQKETHNLQCSGGILADDQGLGKTVSTIALILMERSPSSKSCAIPAKGEFEALNLDEDEEFPNSNGLNQENSNMQVTEGPLKSENTPVRQKGRPAAGTLVVCPTSVLRQWADELRNKVTSEANLSFLVYHGSNRTRDPYELVKYDVVLTTYSIVSMEVPTRSTVDKSDGKGRPDTMGTSFDCSAGKKRKDSPRNFKDPDRVDSSLLESTARPLARVGWFRVILDEAQTIKNHRTQVARACWGLRAKRRWCLSGTPIQNAVDDLYSYFRFLKYEPFSVYNSFCAKIKIPINRDPAVGYRKLQAVLRTIMLRRTKGTLIDGKPIINLPPKTIMLKKVDFSAEERAFYSRLEAESREKFKGYADAGTVKQNYVNILLMLLRLRQACDHPLLVKGCDSSSVWRTSIEAAKKIPRDKQIELLNSLETCLALCTICNDPPEDAVVAVCGHVYCNQCISEHLTGDDNFCPSANCKVKLTGASVFSKATLKSCLSGLPLHDCPEASEVTELLEANTPSHSSKIKAAVELLQSLPTYNDSGSNSSYCLADDKCTVSTKIACSTVSGVYSNDKKDKECLNSAKCSNASVSEKAIVYSQWTRMLDLLEVRLKSLCIQYRRLDGTMTVASRDKAVKDFNTLPEVTVMIMSLKAASLGLNMVSACHVLLLDLWWNPTTEDQAIDRAHRIGQTRPVTVSRLTVENTVEDRILALQEKKREMVASAFGEDESGRSQTRLTVEDLRYLFRV